MLLGIDWLEGQGAVWDLRRGEIHMQGSVFPLKARVIVQEPMMVPARSESHGLGSTVYRDFKSVWPTWVSKPGSPREKLRVARAIVPDRCKDVPLLIMNVVNYPVQLEVGEILSELELAELLKTDDGRSSDGLVDAPVPDPEYAQVLIDGVDPLVSDEAKEELREVLLRFPAVFSQGEDDLGRASAVQHRIDTGNHRPFRQTLRRHPNANLDIIDAHTDSMLQAGLVEPAQSEWASNVVLVRKSDGSMRFCVDYRQLNERTVKDSYPLPRIDVCLDALAGAKWFSTFDLRSGYHQVELDPRDADKTTFVTRRGTFRFRVMPFGLCNAPATFQRLMNVALAGLDPMVCLVYLDDIIVHSPDLRAHLERLIWLFERLLRTGLKLKVSKCKILQREVGFLGHRVSSEGLSTDPAKISAVQDWPVPCCIRDVRSFMGLCGYYRKFVADFSEIAAPLHALTKKNRRFQWDSACQAAFETLKERLVSSPILGLPWDEGEFIVNADASEHAVGAVLSQIQDDEERVIAYYSKLYSRSETNYCTSRKELLAVVDALRQFRRTSLGAGSEFGRIMWRCGTSTKRQT